MKTWTHAALFIIVAAISCCGSALARDAVTEGQYLTTIGDCASCHMVRGKGEANAPG